MEIAGVSVAKYREAMHIPSSVQRRRRETRPGRGRPALTVVTERQRPRIDIGPREGLRSRARSRSVTWNQAISGVFFLHGLPCGHSTATDRRDSQLGRGVLVPNGDRY